jgi:hypothetical protein
LWRAHVARAETPLKMCQEKNAVRTDDMGDNSDRGHRSHLSGMLTHAME